MGLSAQEGRGGRSHKVFLLVACLLLSSIIPLIPTDNGSVDGFGSGDDGVHAYVSLGDSSVNGFGMTGYYKESIGENPYGFMVDVSSSYPHKVHTYLKTQIKNQTVTFDQLAVSDMRSFELRALLDPGFSGDAYTRLQLDPSTSTFKHAFSKLPDGYSKDASGMGQYYRDVLSNADLVTYQFHHDLSYSLLQEVYSLVGMAEVDIEEDFSIFMDDGSYTFIEGLRVQILDLLSELFTSTGVSQEDLDTTLDLVERLVDAIVYTVAGYCTNYDAIIDIMLELNPDVRVVTIDSYNMIGDVTLDMGSLSIPLGGIYTLMIDVVNLYTEYFSRHAGETYHVSLDTEPMLFMDEFRNARSSSDLTKDAMGAFISVLMAKDTVDTSLNALYVTADTKSLAIKNMPLVGPVPWLETTGHNNLTEFISCIFRSDVFDAAYYMDPSTDIMQEVDNLVDKLMLALFDVYSFDPSNIDVNCVGYILKEGGDVFYDEVTGSCTVSCNTGSVTFNKNELTVLWLYLSFMQTSSVMCHPCAQGHLQIYEAVRQRIIDRNILRSETVDEMTFQKMAMESTIPVVDAGVTGSGDVGIVLDLGDMMSGGGSDTTYPDIVADLIGSSLYPLDKSYGLRPDDVNYLLGGTDRHDPYTDAFTDSLGMTHDEARRMYQDAVSGSDTILVNMGIHNLTYAIEQVMYVVQGEEGYTMELSSFDIVTEEMYNDFYKVLEDLDDVIYAIAGDNPDVGEIYESVITAIEGLAYGVVGYMDNYFSMVGRIHELNPDATVVCVGMYDALDGFSISVGDFGLDLDLSWLVNGMAEYTATVLVEFSDAFYVDINDVHTSDSMVDVGSIRDKDDLISLLSSCELTYGEHLIVADRIVGMIADPEYTVEFRIDGDVFTYTYSYGDRIAVPSAPNKTGHVFAGWDCPVPETMPAKDLVFTALWDVESYTVTFDTDGGSVVAPSFHDYMTQAIRPIDPEKEGHTFAGWFLDGVEYDFIESVTENITLVAGWTVNEYTVSFDTDGGSHIPPEVYPFGSSIEGRDVPTKEGHTFAGWFLDGVEYEFTTIPSNDIILVAVWDANPYMISFDTDGGSPVDDVVLDFGSVITLPEIPTKMGYTFAGWFLDGIEFTATVMPSYDLALTAGWDANPYTISFDSTGGSYVNDMEVRYGEPIPLLDVPVREGHSFTGWFLDGIEFTATVMPSYDLALTAGWDLNDYTISFDSKGGSSVVSVEYTYGTEVAEPESPVRYGYSFTGWLLDGVPYVFTTMPAYDLALTAGWNPLQYQISFRVDGVDIHGYPAGAYYDSLVVPPIEDPQKDGMVFIGWDGYEEGMTVDGDMAFEALFKVADEGSYDTIVLVVGAVSVIVIELLGAMFHRRK